jgi:hypothetical protein
MHRELFDSLGTEHVTMELDGTRAPNPGPMRTCGCNRSARACRPTPS